MAQHYYACQMHVVEYNEPAVFTGENEDGKLETIQTQPLIEAVEIPDSRRTTLLVTENGSYACHKERRK